MPRRSTIQRLSAVAVAAAGAIVAGVLAAPPAYAADVDPHDRRRCRAPAHPRRRRPDRDGRGRRHRRPPHRRLSAASTCRPPGPDTTPGALRRHLRLPQPTTAPPASAIGDRVARHGHRRSEFSGVTQHHRLRAPAPSSCRAGRRRRARADARCPPPCSAAPARPSRACSSARPAPTSSSRATTCRASASCGRAPAPRCPSRRSRRGRRHQGRERHHDREQQRPPDPRRRLQRPGRRRRPPRRPALLHEGRGRPQRRHRDLPGRAAEC